MTFPDSSSLGGARAWLRSKAANEGANCPCCGQMTKVYRRALNANMARLLIVLYRDHGQEWVHASKAGDGTGDLAKLRYWGYVETNKPTAGVPSGWWRVTAAGVAFVRGDVQAVRHALVFDGKCIGFADSNDTVTVHDALGDHFDYGDLMSAAGVAPTLTED